MSSKLQDRASRFRNLRVGDAAYAFYLNYFHLSSQARQRLDQFSDQFDTLRLRTGAHLASGKKLLADFFHSTQRQPSNGARYDAFYHPRLILQSLADRQLV